MKGESKFIKLRDGVELHASIHEQGKDTWLIGVHGIGEHLGRHKYLVDLFGHQHNICLFDLRGHGKSQGAEGDIIDFFDFMQDLNEVVGYLKIKYRMQRYILFAHSMGALIAAGFIQNQVAKNADLAPEIIFLSAPPVGIGGPGGLLHRLLPKALVKGLASLPYTVRLGGVVDLSTLSHDPRVKEDYINDPLCAQTLHTRLMLQMARATSEVFSRPMRPPCVAYVVVGSSDRMISPASIRHYFSQIEKGFKLTEFKGAFHEIHNEVEKYGKPYFDYLKKVLTL